MQRENNIRACLKPISLMAVDDVASARMNGPSSLNPSPCLAVGRSSGFLVVDHRVRMVAD